MSEEITFGYTSGLTLKYEAYQPDGTIRTASISLPEIGTTGYYVASDADIEAGDFVIVKKSPYGADDVVGSGQYKPEVSASSITADLADIETKIDTIDTNVDLLIVEQQRVENVYDQETPTETIKVIQNL